LGPTSNGKQGEQKQYVLFFHYVCFKELAATGADSMKFIVQQTNWFMVYCTNYIPPFSPKHRTIKNK